MKYAFLFPGQGSQYVGMGKDFYAAYPEAKAVFDEADEILGYKLSSIIFEGPENVLTETRNSQLAIFVVSVAIFEAFEKRFRISPTCTAGLSLGEYTALYASKRLSFREALLLIQKRAQFMNDACESCSGTMAAIMGLDSEEIKKIVEEIEGVWVANYNTPSQTVISGTMEGIEKASAILKEKGVKRVIPLQVHGAFHSGLMQDAREKLEPYIQKAEFCSSSVPIFMNVTGSLTDEAQIPDNLQSQVTGSVKWRQTIQSMKDFGADVFIEVGCGKSLTAMNRKMGFSDVFAIDSIKDFQEFAIKQEITTC